MDSETIWLIIVLILITANTSLVLFLLKKGRSETGRNKRRLATIIATSTAGTVFIGFVLFECLVDIRTINWTHLAIELVSCVIVYAIAFFAAIDKLY